MRRPLVTLLLLCIAASRYCAAQERLPDSTSASAVKITQQYLQSVSDKSAKITAGLDRQTAKYLSKLEKQEARIKKKLSKIDSLAANNIFAHTQEQYDALQARLKLKVQAAGKGTGQYLPWLDSAGTSLKFLMGSNPLLSNIKGNAAKVSQALAGVKQLEDQFKQAANVKEFIRQRKEYLSAQLKNYQLGGALKQYNQTAFYYTQQVNDYRQLMDDPEKAEKKALSLLRKIPAFQQFFHDHGALAGLFDVPDDYATNMTGLQTQAQVQAVMASQIRSLGPNAQQQVQQNISAAQAELSKLRNRFPSSGSIEDMPDFKPKETKTKSFLQRLEYGTNVQTTKNNYYFPATTDMGASVGYKMSDKNIIGIGASYKIGWGKDIQHIAISSEGVGLRSFADINLKKSFYVSGGFEYNYQQPFYALSAFNAFSSWQQSGLLGISKMVSLKTKFFKKTKVQLLWDMLSYRQVPRTQAVKFRVGYNF